LTACIDVDRSNKRTMSYPLSGRFLQVSTAFPVTVTLRDISIPFHDTA